jgi:ABC-2 type transport system permease protein
VNAFPRAFRAEAYRLRRNRSGLFWGFLFVPAAYLLFGLLLDLVMLRASTHWAPAPNPLWSATRSLAVGGNPIAHLFLASGAAVIFGGEYRYASWRLLCPRLPRSALLLAKWATYLLAAGAMLAMLFLGGLAEAELLALVTGASATAPSVVLPGLATAFFGTFLEMAVLGALIAGAVVTTRSTIGAILIGFLFSFGQTLLLSMLTPPSMFSPWLLMPAAAGDSSRRYALLAGGVAPVSTEAALASLFILAAWSAAFLMLALAVFASQDFSRE